VTTSRPTRPDKLSPHQQEQIVAAIRLGVTLDAIALVLEVPEKQVLRWVLGSWDSLGDEVQQGLVKSLDATARRLAEALPLTRAMVAGFDASAGGNGAAGDAPSPKRQPAKAKAKASGRRKRKRRRPVKQDQPVEQPVEQAVEQEQADGQAYAETWALAHARKAEEPPAAVPPADCPGWEADGQGGDESA
jgi:hypothetical protein